VQNILSSSFFLSKNIKIKVYRTIIFPVVLCGCETWSLTFRELRMFENRVLRRMYGPKRDEVTGSGENYTLRSLMISTPHPQWFVSRRTRWTGHVARQGERRSVYRVLVGKPEGKRPLGRPRLIWEDNIKMDLQEVGCGVIDWIKLAQDRDRWRALVNAVMNFWAP
jgi:hypothetical protein